MNSAAAERANPAAGGAVGSETGASVDSDRGKVSRGPYPEEGSGQDALLMEAESKAARRQARRIRANERRREKRLAARLRVQERAAKAREEERLSLESARGQAEAAQGAAQVSIQTAGDGNSTRNPQGGSQVSYYRVPIVMPGMGTPQGQQHHRSCPSSGGVSVSSQQSSGGSAGGAGSSPPSIGGPWGAGGGARGGSSSGGGSSGFGAGGSGFGRNSGPMDSAAIHALLSDPTKSKILMSNLLSERVKEVEFARRKRDSLMDQKRRLEGERFKAQQRQRANMERKRQPTLPIDDALLHSLPPMECGVILRAGSSDEEERPRVVAKKLTITSAMAGPILRVWDFLHTTSQVITLSPFGLDDFADSLHYTGGPSVMVVEVHTRLLSVILRDGKFPKSLKEALEAGTVAVDSSSNGGGLAGTGSKQVAKYPVGVDSPGGGAGGVSRKGKGSASRTHSRRRSMSSIGPDGTGEGLEGDGDDEREDLLAYLLPPRSERNEHHDNANNLVTPLTWQTVLALALPRMGPYARAVAPPSIPKDAPSAAAAPAGTPMSGRGSGFAVMATERVESERAARGRALMRARRNLIEKEYPSLTLEEKVLLLEVLVDTAYETKRIRTVLEENMRDRMTLESQRREEIITYNRELREKVNAQKAKVQAKLRKSNEAQYRRRVIESEKAARERAKKAGDMVQADHQVVVQNGAASRAVTTSDGGSSSGDRNGDSNGSGEGGDGSPSGGGGTSKGKGKAKKGKGKAASPEGGTGSGGGGSGGGLLKINPKVYEPDRAQLQAGIAEDTVKDACGGEFRVKSIDVPEDDVDPTEQEEEEDKAAEKVMLENMSRQELIRRRREMDAKEKDRARRRQDWKDSRQHRLQQGRALNSLKVALEKGELHMLQEALKEGRKASLEGEDEDGVRFLCPEMRDAYLALAAAKERMGRVEILEKYRKLMEDKFVRTEPLGTDRHGNRYWMFNGDSRIHMEIVVRKPDAPSPPVTGNGNASKNSPSFAIEAEPMIIVDDEHDIKGSAVANGNISEFSANGIGSTGKRKVEEGVDAMKSVKRPRHDPPDYYHPVWFESTWTYYDSEEEFHNLIMRLDPRGKREGELRQALQERFDVAELERRSKETSNRASVGKRRLAWRKEGSALVGKRVRRVFGRRVAGAEVLKWVPAESNGGMALWHVQHDDGDEEDLEEHEVKESLALAEAEEQQGADSGRAVSELMRVAVDGSLAKSFLEYANRLNKMQAIKPRDLGLCALRENLLHREAGMLDDIKERSSGYSKGTNSATPRGTWLRLVREATGISHLREAILTLEETLRGLQAGEDKIEGGRMEMEAKGWNFDPDSHIFIGRRCRRFFKEYGQSNCTVVAYLPAKNNDPELWHVLHDDGDAEDLEAHELEKAAKHYEDGVEELPISDADEDGEDDGSRESSGPADDVNDDEDQHDDHDEDVEDQMFSPSPTKHRATLWETWGARQGWIKGINAAATVATLSLGFLTLVETAYLFGIGKESMLEANRSRARMAKAWETPGGSSKSGKRAAAVAASMAISNFAEMDVDVSEASVSAAASTASSASSTAGGNASNAGGGKRRSSRETTGGSGSGTSGGDAAAGGASTRSSGKRQRR